MNGKNVLVTGANGHVGFVLTKLLVERGYNVRASVRDKDNKELTKNLSDFDVDIVSLNLMHPETIEPAMANIDGVFQVAAVYKSWAKNSAVPSANQGLPSPPLLFSLPVLSPFTSVSEICACW